jgi:hypothetical protein
MAKLIELKKEVGSFSIRKSPKFRDDKPFGRWILNSKQLARRGLLSSDKIQQLKDLGMLPKNFIPNLAMNSPTLQEDAEDASSQESADDDEEDNDEAEHTSSSSPNGSSDNLTTTIATNNNITIRAVQQQSRPNNITMHPIKISSLVKGTSPTPLQTSASTNSAPVKNLPTVDNPQNTSPHPFSEEEKENDK